MAAHARARLPDVAKTGKLRKPRARALGRPSAAAAWNHNSVQQGALPRAKKLRPKRLSISARARLVAAHSRAARARRVRWPDASATSPRAGRAWTTIW